MDRFVVTNGDYSERGTIFDDPNLHSNRKGRKICWSLRRVSTRRSSVNKIQPHEGRTEAAGHGMTQPGQVGKRIGGRLQ